MNPLEPVGESERTEQEKTDAFIREEALKRRTLLEIFARGPQLALPDPREPSDPLLTEMARLASLSQAERETTLERYLLSWHRAQANPLSIARYLACAGLTLDQAQALYLKIQYRELEQLKEQAYRKIYTGIFIVLSSLPIAWFQPLPIWGLLFLMALFSGILTLSRGIGELNRVTPTSDLFETEIV